MASASGESADSLLHVGWREWVELPELAPGKFIKAKIDTGAATSAFHAEELELFEREGDVWCRFLLLPRQNSKKSSVMIERPTLDLRAVRSSNGQTEERPVIASTMLLGSLTVPVEITLTSRDDMGYRMLVGRKALNGRALVDVSRSYVASSRRSTKI